MRGFDPRRGRGVSCIEGMKSPNRPASVRVARPPRRPGTYTSCAECGRLLKIEWATRSIVCSCGARVAPPPRDGK
jgi:hypothetical protein